MLAAAHLAAELPGTFRLGPLRFPVYGLFATAGLLSALGLSQPAARRAGLRPEALWDAGIFAVATAFVVSRLLLIVQNWAAFRAMPLLVLALPSLTPTGIAATLLLTLGYLRRKRLPVRRALDAWVPPLCLLAAWLQLGHFFEGTEAGLPTTLPWGVFAAGDTVLGRTHPVQLYAVAAALGLGCWLYLRLPRRRFDGEVAALGLGVGGALAFALDMLRQPRPDTWPGINASLPLDASQMAAALCVLAAILLWWRQPAGRPAAAQRAPEPATRDGSTASRAAVAHNQAEVH